MILQKLLLTHFKNYTSATVGFSPKLNVITGKNGMGKTNLLDAIYYIGMGKSGISGNDRLVVQKGADFFRLEGHFLKNGQKDKVVAKVIPGKQKILEYNGVAYTKIAEHVGKFPVVMVAPNDTTLVTGGSEERRRFMDTTLCQSDAGYLNALLRYNRVLKNRNAALKQMGASHFFDATLLESFDRQMVTPATLIFEKRRAFLMDIEPVFNEYYRVISNQQETVEFEYKSQLSGNDFAELLKGAREKDRLLQRSTAGIHRDDLIFRFNDLNLKQYASQGQI
ncbi:MAG: DNA replication and repair protein RecF, partial [Bacteroidetes bacterium]